MNRDVSMRMVLAVAIGLGALQALGADADEIRVNMDSGAFPDGRPEWCPETIIVRFSPIMPADVRLSILQQNECVIEKTSNSGDYHLVKIPASGLSEQFVSRFQSYAAVEYVGLNYYVYAAFVPNDRLYSRQWHLDNSGTGGIRMEKAWNIQRASPDVIVAVVDTGVAYEDFEGFLRAPDLANTHFVPGYDFVHDDEHPNDDQGHGTHVAGTIAQSTHNDIGVAGVAFGCSIMPIKVLDREGSGTVFNVARGILFAVENGATIVNLSLGTNGNSQMLRDAVATALAQGVTCVCAAGNGALFGHPISYPAGYAEFCVGVGATRYDERRSWYSTAQTYVDVVAPGGDLSVDQNRDGYPDGVLQQTFREDPREFAYWYLQGTSMATPHVSGLAALLASRGVTRPDKIADAITRTARDRGPEGWDEEYGWGLIDASAALAYRVQGDFGSDNVVDAGDLMVFLTQWLQTTDSIFTRLDSDLNRDRRVDLVDFAILAANWDG
jgi:serine protease